MTNFLSSLWHRVITKEADHLKLGKWGEKQAVKYLKKKGYKIVGQRVMVGKRDELDIAAFMDSVLVFVEVKTRTRAAYYRPATAVDKRKQKALSRAASAYLARMKQKPDVVRFDVIEVVGDQKEAPEIHHLEQAFSMSQFKTFKW